jgi:hypothetical protein
MVQLIAHTARARVYCGDWIADCPRPDCGGAEHLYSLSNPRNPRSPRVVQKSEFHCTNCQLTAPVEWPPNLADITAVLMLRPVPQTRIWYPAGHDEAVKCNIPHGQSVDELREENAEHGVPTGAVA